jgi:hypothetical protein
MFGILCKVELTLSNLDKINGQLDMHLCIFVSHAWRSASLQGQ